MGKSFLDLRKPRVNVGSFPYEDDAQQVKFRSGGGDRGEEWKKILIAKTCSKHVEAICFQSETRRIKEVGTRRQQIQRGGLTSKNPEKVGVLRGGKVLTEKG